MIKPSHASDDDVNLAHCWYGGFLSKRQEMTFIDGLGHLSLENECVFDSRACGSE